MIEYRKRAKILHAMSHPVRLEILEIQSHGPACVCDLVGRTRKRQAYISQHLMLLRQTGLVKSTPLGAAKQYEPAQPEITTNILKCVLQDQQCKEPNQGKIKMSTTPNNNAWHGIPREKIEWTPMIVADRCVGCGLCVTSCGRGVYAFDYEANKPVVMTPLMCMVGCTTCATICTQDAIEFPSQGYIRQVIKKNKIVTQSKNMLRADPNKYDIKKRTPAAG
jgi:NAD-dependent dihydropyrimidine dehydrogenase PreA subunit